MYDKHTIDPNLGYEMVLSGDEKPVSLVNSVLISMVRGEGGHYVAVRVCPVYIPCGALTGEKLYRYNYYAYPIMHP